MLLRTTRRTVVAVAGAALLFLAACGGDEEEADLTPTTEEEDDEEVDDTTTTGDEESTTTEAAGAGGGGGEVELTPAGTALAVGDQAVVPFEDADEPGVVGITLTALDQGAIEDLAAFEVEEDISTFTPFYARLTIENLGDAALPFANPTSALVLDDGAQQSRALILFASFDTCQSESAPGDFGPGATLETCVTYLSSTGAVEALAYTDINDQVDYFESPITWTP